MTSDEIKTELKTLREAVTVGFARSDGELATLREAVTRNEVGLTAVREAVTTGFARSDGELANLREAVSRNEVGLTAVREAVTTGSARADRYFGLQHVQLQEVVDSLTALTARVDRLEGEVQSLRSEFSTFRDWCAREFAEVHRELRDLRRVGAGQSAEIQLLSARVDRLEHLWNGSRGPRTEST